MARLKEAWKPVLVLGTLGIGAFNTPLYTGLLTTTAVNGLLLQEEKTCWIIALIVGGIAGWLARLVMNRDASIGIFWNIVVVCIGSPIGNAVAGPGVPVTFWPKVAVVGMAENSHFLARSVC